MISQAGLGRAGVTGDKAGSFQKLARLLLRVHYPTLFARESALEGNSATFTPMLRYALTSMSHLLSRRLLNLGYEIYAVSDAKFMEVAYRICVSFFHYYPVLSLQQYQHKKGYAERKMNLVATVVQMSLNKHAELAREAKAAAKNMPAGAAASSKKKKRQPDAQRMGDDHNEGDEDHPSSAEGQVNPAIVDAMGSSSMELASASASASASAASSSRGRRRSFSQERPPLSLNAPAPAAPSASASRARSPSASRGVPSHSVKKKAQVAARRPKTASSNPNAGSLNASVAGWQMQQQTGFDGNTSISSIAMGPPPAHATDLYTSASTSSAYGTAFAPSSSRHRMAGQQEEVSIESMAPHAVERSTHPNGEVLDLHEGLSASQHSMNQSQRTVKGSPVKKAWVSEHDKGSRGVNVVGYVDQTSGFGESSPAASRNDAAARARNAEFSRAQDLTKLRRREAQAEEDRLRLLQLNHQEYATQNSPHVDPSANNAARRAWEREGDLDEEEEGKQAPAPQPFREYAAEQQQNQSPPRFATQSAQLSASQRIALTSPHVVGTEHELNSSFHRTGEPRIQRGGTGQAPPATHVHPPGHAHRQERQQQLQQSHSQSQLHSQQQQQGGNDLSSINDALSQIADRNTVTAKRVAQHSAKKMPRSQYQEQQQQQQQQSQSQVPSHPEVSSMLSSATPNTALETKLLSMLEQISSKMAAMENNMQAMEKKLAAASVAQQQQQPPQQPSQPAADPYSSHPAPSSQYRSQSRDSAPLTHPLVPEFAGHMWTPASSFYGPARDRNGNVNAMPEQAQRALRAEAVQKDAEAREQQRRQQQQQSQSEEKSNTAGRYIPPTLPPRPGFAPHSPGPRPHAPQHGSVPTRAPVAHAVPSQSTAFGGASSSSSSASSFQPTQSHNQPSPVITTGGSMPLSSFPPHSAFHPGHATAGSASLSRDQVIPSTDSFIESLKARLRQTEELIHTARTTAKDTEDFNPYQQPPYERPA